MKIEFKKKFGQNFLSDGNLLQSIVKDSGVTKTDTVVEIGAGAGALTRCLAKNCKKVVSFEIDTDLQDILQQNLSDFDNVDLHFCDFLHLDTQKIIEYAGTNFVVVANLPYYITSPLITKLLNKDFGAKSITVMVQKEVGDRIVAEPKSKDYGVLSIMVQLCSKPRISRGVSRKMFTPEPNVDSCIVCMENISVPDNYDKIVELAKLAFSARRKTLVNNLSKTYGKDKVLDSLKEIGVSPNARAEELLPSLFAKLLRLLDKN